MDVRPVPGPVQHAGTFDVGRNRWLSPTQQTAVRAATLMVYDNTCTWTGGLFYVVTGDCEDFFGDGRIPGGVGSPPDPLGSTTDNLINFFEFAYCTSVLTGAVDIKVGFYDTLGGPCLGAVAPTPPSLSTRTPLGGFFNFGAVSGFPLPGATTAGVVECRVVGITNFGFCLQSDADGIFDNSAALDNFAWSFQMDNPSGPSDNGIVISGEPGSSPVSGCTYNVPCGVDAIYGHPCGHGLGQDDTFWINVDADLAGDDDNTGASCVGFADIGTDCYWFGGHSGNPYSGFHLKLGSAGECAGCDNDPTGYCTASTSSIGCVGTLVLASGVASAGPNVAPAILSAIGVDGARFGRIGFSLQPTVLPWSATGALCIAAPYYWSPKINSGGGVLTCNGSLSVDFNHVLQLKGGVLLGTPMFAGTTVYAQSWYVDTNLGRFKDRLTSALSFTLCP